MDAELLQIIHRLLGTARMAALGTLREGAPFVSLTTTAPADDFSAFWLHLSRLAFHTRHIEADPRVSLMFWEEAGQERNPQTLARISLAGEAVTNRPRIRPVRGRQGLLPEEESRQRDVLPARRFHPVSGHCRIRTARGWLRVDPHDLALASPGRIPAGMIPYHPRPGVPRARVKPHRRTTSLPGQLTNLQRKERRPCSKRNINRCSTSAQA